MIIDKPILFDAGVFIGALLKGDTRHREARIIVESARRGEILAFTTTSIISEVYAALTWVHSVPPHSPTEAANSVRLIFEQPSAINILTDDYNVSIRMLEISEKYFLKARKVHDAKHAASALVNEITQIYTYDNDDWKIFKPEGLSIIDPAKLIEEITMNKT